MICVVNPDGTITCSDGDGAIANELTKVAAEGKKGPVQDVEKEYPGALGHLLKAVGIMLENEQPAMALLLVNKTVVDTA